MLDFQITELYKLSYFVRYWAAFQSIYGIHYEASASSRKLSSRLYNHELRTETNPRKRKLLKHLIIYPQDHHARKTLRNL